MPAPVRVRYDKTMDVCVIIPAAGASARYARAGGVRSKLNEDLGGRPVLQRTVEMFTKRDEVGSVVVAGPADDEAWQDFVDRHADRIGLLGATLCRGGKETRTQSVRNALEHVPEEATHVAVHDGARPCMPPELLDRVFQAAASFDAVIPAIPVPDTLKRVSDDEEEGAEADPLDAILGNAGAAKARAVLATVDRDGLHLVQTPQVFSRDLLVRAYAQADDGAATDDASLVERLGERVVVVEGDPRNIKITRPWDIPLARGLMGLSASKSRPTHKKF